MAKSKFILIPLRSDSLSVLQGKNGIELIRTTPGGEVVVWMTPQRAGALRRELPGVKVEPVVAVRPA